MDHSANPHIKELLASLRASSSNVIGLDRTPISNGTLPVQNDHSNNVTGFSGIPGLGPLPKNEATSQQVLRDASQPTLKPLQNQHQQIGSRTSSPAVPDASVIVTWPAALKHVTRYIASDEDLANKIKNLIGEQHRMEQEWWNGREAVVARQTDRSGTSDQVAALLKSIGGKEMPREKVDPKVNEAELSIYDKKIYSDLIRLASRIDRQLKAMGIPFFAIKHDLVIMDDGKDNTASIKGRIDKGELRELQRRMLQTLEDLFTEEMK